MRCGTIASCQSAATSEIVKALLVTSLTHVSGAITSVLTFTFTFTNTPVNSELYISKAGFRLCAGQRLCCGPCEPF